VPVLGPEVLTVANGEVVVHTPPDIASLRVMLLPPHTVVGPVIAAGDGITVTVVYASQPTEYVIVAVPAAPGVTTPELEPIDATPGLPLVQIPPGVPSVRFSEPVRHTGELPDIAEGGGLTVTTCVERQPVLDNV